MRTRSSLLLVVVVLASLLLGAPCGTQIQILSPTSTVDEFTFEVEFQIVGDIAPGSLAGRDQPCLDPRPRHRRSTALHRGDRAGLAAARQQPAPDPRRPRQPGKLVATRAFKYLPPGKAHARQIEDPEDLIRGPLGHSRIGDYLLENGTARFAIQDVGQRELYSVGTFGGNLIDAELVGRPGKDNFLEVQAGLNIETVINAQTRRDRERRPGRHAGGDPHLRARRPARLREPLEPGRGPGSPLPCARRRPRSRDRGLHQLQPRAAQGLRPRRHGGLQQRALAGLRARSAAARRRRLAEPVRRARHLHPGPGSEHRVHAFGDRSRAARRELRRLARLLRLRRGRGRRLRLHPDPAPAAGREHGVLRRRERRPRRAPQPERAAHADRGRPGPLPGGEWRQQHLHPLLRCRRRLAVERGRPRERGARDRHRDGAGLRHRSRAARSPVRGSASARTSSRTRRSWPRTSRRGPGPARTTRARSRRAPTPPSRACRATSTREARRCRPPSP